MAKRGIDITFTAYSRRDPVTGTVKSHLRKKRSIQTSKRLKEFQACIRNAMAGKTFRTGKAGENAKAVRLALAAAAKNCR